MHFARADEEEHENDGENVCFKWSISESHLKELLTAKGWINRAIVGS